MRVELHPEAQAEFRAAAIWYDERQLGLGDRFVAEVTSTLGRVSESPQSCAAWTGSGGSFRKASVQGFPYLVAFEVIDDTVFVLAVAHGKRRPMYWLPRSRGPV